MKKSRVSEVQPRFTGRTVSPLASKRHDTGMYEYMKPYLNCLELCGMWNNEHVLRYLDIPSPPPSFVRRVLLRKVVPLVSALLIVCNLVRLSVSFYSHSNSVISRIVYFTWNLSALSAQIILWCIGKRHLPTLLRYVKDQDLGNISRHGKPGLFDDTYNLQNMQDSAGGNRSWNLTLPTAFAWSSPIAAIFNFALLVIGLHSGMRLFFRDIILPVLPNDVPGMIFIYVSHLVASIIWFNNKGMVLIVTKYFQNLYVHLRTSMDEIDAEQTNRSMIGSRMTRVYRLYYEKLSKSVDLADEAMNKLIFLTYSGNVCGILILLYYVVTMFTFRETDSSAGVGLLLASSFWLTACFVDLYVTLYFSALVTDKGKDISTSLLDQKWNEHNSYEAKQELMLFKLDVQLNYPAFTCWKYFEIDLSSFLNITGILVTYFFLMYQFQIS